MCLYLRGVSHKNQSVHAKKLHSFHWSRAEVPNVCFHKRKRCCPQNTYTGQLLVPHEMFGSSIIGNSKSFGKLKKYSNNSNISTPKFGLRHNLVTKKVWPLGPRVKRLLHCNLSWHGVLEVWSHEWHIHTHEHAWCKIVAINDLVCCWLNRMISTWKVLLHQFYPQW